MDNPHDRVKIIFGLLEVAAFACVMHLHENHSIKRAGVVKMRARAEGV
ncbi:hypothetical protein ACOJCD_000350 [Cronobacter dublinensis]